MNDHAWSLFAIGIMMSTAVGGSFLNVWWARFIDERRDAVMSGAHGPESLTLTQRWQYFSDWISNVAGLAGVNVFLGFAYLRIARLSEDGPVAWLGYFGLALSLWTAAMFVLQGFLEAFVAARKLRREKHAAPV